MTTKRPSFLKRQKEMKRNARALEKREARQGRREARAAERNISVAPDPPGEAGAAEPDISVAPDPPGEGTELNHDPEL
jgi:hypothetical protein